MSEQTQHEPKVLPMQHADQRGFYSNAVSVAVSGYDVMLRLLLDAPSDGPDRELLHLTDVRLSHGNAWTLAHLILRGLKQMADAEGMFVVPRDTLERLDLTEEYASFRRKSE